MIENFDGSQLTEVEARRKLEENFKNLRVKAKKKMDFGFEEFEFDLMEMRKSESVHPIGVAFDQPLMNEFSAPNSSSPFEQ